uniref:Uncharacterized protein n=1 Tax=Cacopsylla melanoneura TaxID=428564 RepID=A0A8D8X613_9HEMI
MEDTRESKTTELFLQESMNTELTLPFTTRVELMQLNMYTTLFISAPSTTRFELSFWYSTSHFFPSLANTGGLLIGAAGRPGEVTALCEAGVGPDAFKLGFL